MNNDLFLNLILNIISLSVGYYISRYFHSKSSYRKINSYACKNDSGEYEWVLYEFKNDFNKKRYENKSLKTGIIEELDVNQFNKLKEKAILRSV